MVQSEVVFKIGGAKFGPCAETAKDPASRIHVAYPAFEPEEGVLVGLYTAEAARGADGPGALASVLAASYPQVQELPGPNGAVHCWVRLDRAQLREAGSPELFAMDAFPRGTLLGPGMISEGRFHLRAVVPGDVDLERIMKVKDEGLANGRWSSFQLMRTGAFSPRLAVDGVLAEPLTPKQHEVVKSALALGYYESPRSITLDHLAEMFGISKAAVHNRLQAAERKIVTSYFQ